MRPLHDYILVQREMASEKSTGGILLPQSTLRAKNSAKVLAVGPGKRDANGVVHPPSVNVGDTVLLNEFATILNVESEDESLVLLREEDVLAVL